jgi:CRP-like cAMP-binding protein
MEQFKAKTFERGEVLLEEDAPATGLYILLHGRLVVTKGRDDEEVQLAELNPGEMFGEMSLLSNTPTTAKVTAVTDCFVIRLSKRKFQEVMMTHPHVLEVVAKISEERKQDNEHLLGPRLSHHAAILV